MTQIQPRSPAQILHSPLNQYSETASKIPQQTYKSNSNIQLTTMTSFNPQISITQKQILSHALILQVLSKSKKKTIQHDVNRIPIQTKLYNIPKQPITKQFDFSIIPPNNKDYVSTASQKVKQINFRLNDKKDLSQRLNQLAQKNINLCIEKRKQRPFSADNTNVNKRVSVSGLVTYNFNSIKARRSLGSIPDQPQQIVLSKKISDTKRRNSSSVDRQIKIINRKPNIYNLQKMEISNAAVCDFHTSTDKFLKVLKKESQKDQKIYGQKMEKLNCIKQYMEKQKSQYQHAQFIVDSILNSQQKHIKAKIAKKIINNDDDIQLAKRRKALSRKKVMLRHLYFTE